MMSRPDIGLLRNFVQVNGPFINTSPDSPYVVYNSPTAAHTAANVVGYNWVFPASAGNAALKPMTADQIVVVCLSGRGDKDVDAVARRLGMLDV